MDKIYLLIGNDTPLAVCLRKSEGEGDPVPYDLSTAERMRLALVGHGMHVFAEDIEISGEDDNIVSGVIPGRSLLKGDYNLEVTFNLDGRDKRFAVKDMFEAVDFLAEDADGEAEGEGAGIFVTVTVQPELIEIAGPTGPKGDTPVLTADEDGTIYADGVLLTEVVKDAAEQAIDAAQEAEEAAETIDAKIAGKADIDGYYPKMSVGSLVGTEVTQVEGITTVANSTGLAKINEVMGRSLVWNQLVKNGDFSDGLTDWNQSGVIATVNADDVTIHCTSESYTAQNINQALPTISGHKYFLSLVYKSDTSAVIYLANLGGISLQATESFIELKQIMTSTGYNTLRIYASTDPQYSPSAIFTLKKHIVVIDLTQLFGAGSEPSTVAEFESWLANNIGYRDYYAYNPGEIISNNTEALEITGLNQWDEEWEVGAIDATTGAKKNNPTSIRSKNDIEVFPNTTYNYYCSANNAGSARVAFLDSEHNTISVKVAGILNSTFVTPGNCFFIRFSTHATQYGNVYKHDICISVSGSRNGEYEPYQKSELELNLATITGKLNGEGESVVIFPDGMRSAGTAFDSLIVDEDGWCRRAVRRLNVADIGQQTINVNGSVESCFYFVLADAYNRFNAVCSKYPTNKATVNATTMPDKSIVAAGGASTVIYLKDSAYSDAASVKTALSGVPFVYEIAPIEYVLDTPIQMTFQAKHGGVIRQLPENGSEPTTAPMRMSVTYALPPEALISGASLENLLNALKTANKITNYTMTYNPTSGKWEFTIS